MPTLFKAFRKNIGSVVIGLFFAIVLIVSVIVVLKHSKTFSDELIVRDIQDLQSIFQRINDSCTILSFDRQENFVDFLTVKAFVSSEIGSMNLAYPNKWEGPYVKDNPTIQGEVYRIMKTHKGYYLVPGYHVKLSNGIILDKDLIFDETSDIDQMITDPNKLLFKGQPLAARISINGEKLARKLDFHALAE